MELIDANDLVMSIIDTDDNGVESIRNITEERAFPIRFTGFSFYTPFRGPVRPIFEFNGEDGPAVPLFDKLNIKADKFDLKISRDYGERVAADGTTINNPDYTDYIDFGFRHPEPPNSREKLNMIKGANTAFEKSKSSVQDQIDQGIQGTAEEQKNTMEKLGLDQKGMEKNANKKALNNAFGKPQVRYSVAVGFGFEYKYNKEKNQYIFAGGSYLIGGSFGIGKTFYSVIYGVPCYVNFDANITMNFSGNYLTDQGKDITPDDVSEEYNPLEMFLPDSAWNGSAGGHIKAGVGICGVVGAWGKIGVNVIWRVGMDEKTRDAKPTDGFYAEMNGALGLDLLIMTISYGVTIPLGGTGIYAKNRRSPRVNTPEAISSISPYNIGDSTWTANRNSTTPKLRSMPEEVSHMVMVEGALQRTKPQITMLADGRKLMTYLDNNGTHPINGQRLMMSVYRPESNMWSVPSIISTPGRAAVFPEIHEGPGGNIAITWSEASKAFGSIPNDDEEKVRYTAEILKSLDIKYRLYQNDLGNMMSLTDESNQEEQYMDVNPSFNFDTAGNRLITYYMKRDIGQILENLDGNFNDNIARLAGVDATYTTMCYKVYDQDNWGIEGFVDVNIPNVNDPLILDFTVSTRKIGNDYAAIYAFTYDVDNSLQTSEDRDVYLGAYNITQDKKYDALNITNSYTGETGPQLNILEEELVLTWVTDGNTINLLNIDDLLVKEEWDVSDVESDDEVTVTGETVSLENMFGSFKSDNVSGRSYISQTFGLDHERGLNNLGSHKIVSGADGNYYLFWIDDAYDERGGGSRELYGAIYINNGGEDGDKQSGFSRAVKITKFAENFNAYFGGQFTKDNSQDIPGLILDEIDISVNNDGKMALVCNMYGQRITEDGDVELSRNKLSLVEFEPKNSLEIQEFAFDKKYPNDETTVSIQVENTGLTTVKGFEAAIYNDSSTTPIETISSDECILPGNTWDVSLPISVAGTEKIIAIVKEKGLPDEHQAELLIEKGAEIEFINMMGRSFTLNTAEITSEVINKGNTTSEAFEVEAFQIIQGEKVKSLGMITIPAIEPGVTANISNDINIDMDDLDEFASITVSLEVPEDIDIAGVSTFDMTMHRPVDIVVNNNINTISLEAGKSLKLNSSVEPSRFFQEEGVYSVEDNSIATITAEGNLYAVAPGETTVTILYLESGLTKSMPLTVEGSSPEITGPHSMTLNKGYSSTSTDVFTITGTTPVTVRKISGDEKITWNDTTNKLDIAAGLVAGTYPVTLTASNVVLPDANFTFTLTVEESPKITGPQSMTLTTGYTPTSTDVYTITGTTPVTVIKISGDDKITWNDTTNKLDIAAGLAAGTYPVTLAASNGVLPDASFTFTLTVEVPENTYTITYHLNGGSQTGAPMTYTRPGNAVTLPTPTRTGYTFAGWFTTSASAGGNKVTSIGAVETGNKEYWARWTVKMQITFDANKGTGTMAKQTADSGKSVKLSANKFSRAGYTFEGWSTSPSGRVVYKNSASININEDTTLYAVWKIRSLKITFHNNKGTGSMPAQTVNYNVSTKLNAKPSRLKRTGYTFKGWATKQNGKVTYKNKATIKTTENTTLYAVWEAKTYKVTFKANKGKGTMKAQSVKYNTAKKLSKNKFKRTGYRFMGWATKANAKNPKYNNRASVKFKKNTTLHAVWKKK